MRKKSHISLTKGVVHGLSAEQRFGHRLSLYVGSILPDCTPSFLTDVIVSRIRLMCVKRRCLDS